MKDQAHIGYGDRVFKIQSVDTSHGSLDLMALTTPTRA